MENKLNNSLLSKQFDKWGIDGLFSADLSNIRYISNFVGTLAYTLITKDKKIIIVDHRYLEQTKNQCKGFEIKKLDSNNNKPIEKIINELSKELSIKNLGFEKNNLVFNVYKKINDKLEDVNFVPTEKIIENLRSVKSVEEINIIKEGLVIANKAYEYLLSEIHVGNTEKELARKLEAFMLLNGGEDKAFNTILNSGVRTCMPHGRPTDKRIEKGDAVTVDFGVLYKEYRTDTTRTFFVGECNNKQKEVYNYVKEAQARAIKKIKRGIVAKEAYYAARSVVENTKYINYFRGLGHGVGLEVHEQPFMNMKSEDELEAGMIVTVEPGIYIPDFGGTRIEDMILITKEGRENLTITNKELTIV